MHVIAGVVKDSCVRSTQPQQRITQSLLQYEQTANGRFPNGQVSSIAGVRCLHLRERSPLPSQHCIARFAATRTCTSACM